MDLKLYKSVLQKLISLPEEYLPQVNDFSMKRPVDGNYMIQSANNLLFHSKMSLFLKEENYQVAVYHAPIIGDDEEHISQMLSAPIEDFSPIYGRFRCYISGAFGFENGYAVILKAKGEGHKGSHLNQFIDLFDRNGKFIRRIQSDLTITPSSNSSEVFVLETKGENDYLVIQSDWL